MFPGNSRNLAQGGYIGKHVIRASISFNIIELLRCSQYFFFSEKSWFFKLETSISNNVLQCYQVLLQSWTQYRETFEKLHQADEDAFYRELKFSGGLRNF